MNILEAVNAAYPDTIIRLGLSPFPGSQPYGNVHVLVGSGKTLPSWSEIEQLVQTYEESSLRKGLLFSLSAHRYKIETGGIVINNMAVATDDRAKLMLNGARNAALADEEFVTKWKTPQGFVTLSAAQIIALSDAVAAHVNKCFMAEATVAANVASYDTDAEIIAAFNQEMA